MKVGLKQTRAMRFLISIVALVFLALIILAVRTANVQTKTATPPKPASTPLEPPPGDNAYLIKAAGDLSPVS
jgi:hypothetical protein